MQFLVFIFHYVKILAALYKGFLGCVFLCEFSVSTDCVRQSALPADCTCWFGMFLLTMSLQRRKSRHCLWVHHRGADGLLQFLKGLYHLFVPVGIIQRAFIGLYNLPASSFAAQVAELGVRLFSNWFLQKTEIVFQLRALQGAHRLVWVSWCWQSDSDEITGNRNFRECVHGGGQI